MSDNANILRGEGISQLAASFTDSADAMGRLVERLDELTAIACKGGGDKAVQRHKKRGKLPPRDRIRSILDTGAPFLELSQLAGHEMYGMACLC